MTNIDAINALKEIKTYVAANLLDHLDYAIKVLEKLEKEGITSPLETELQIKNKS